MDLGNLIEATTNYIKMHPNLSCVILFSWSFLETALLLGLILPAEKVLIVSSILVSEKIISPISFIVCVSSGTFLGYTVSYFAGALLGKSFLEKLMERFKVSPKQIEKTKKFVEEKGEFSLIFGRFLPVVRATLPVVIGSFKPNFFKFSLFNLAGAVLWALSYVLLGNLIRDSFSFIITHKLTVSFVTAIFLIAYILWRRYGKNRKVL